MASRAEMRKWDHALQQISIQSGRQLPIEDGIVIGLAQEGELAKPFPWASQAKSVKVQKKPSTKTSQKSCQKTSQKKPTSVPKQPLQKRSQKKPASVVKQQLQKKRTPKERKRIQNKAKLFRPILRLAAEFKKRFISMK